MKFIERLFGKKQEKEESHSAVFEFRELAAIVTEESEKQTEELKPVVGERYRSIRASLSELEKLKEDLLSAEPIENVSKRGEKLGDSNRDNVVNNLNLIHDKLKVPEDTSPITASEFFKESKSLLKTVLDNTSRSLMYIKALYPREHQKINQGLAELEDSLDELYSAITQGIKRVESLEQIASEIENIKKIEEEMDNSAKKIQEMHSRYDASKEKVVKAESRLAELVNSEEFEKAKQLKSEIKTVELEITDIEAEAKRLFTPLSKALSRMEKQDNNEKCVLSPDNRAMLKSIKEEPANAIEEDIDPFLSELTNRIESGELGLKEQMCEKALKQIEVLSDRSVISSLVEHRKEHLEEKDELLEELNSLSIYQEKEDIEKVMEKYNQTIKDVNDDIDSESKHVFNLKEEIEIKKSDLLSNIREIFGEETEIKYNE
jgi:myosin heavy subunit